MKLRQLIEGQQEQIVSLRRSSPVALYHPTDIEGAARIVVQRDRPDQYAVTPSLKSAIQRSDVVVQFYGQGKDLEAPKEATRSHGDRHWAEKAYPDSFNPLVSFSLLSQRPRAIFTGLVGPSNIEKIYVMQNGEPDAMSPEYFLDYSIKVQGDARRQEQGLTW